MPVTIAVTYQDLYNRYNTKRSFPWVVPLPDLVIPHYFGENNVVVTGIRRHANGTYSLVIPSLPKSVAPGGRATDKIKIED